MDASDNVHQASANSPNSSFKNISSTQSFFIRRCVWGRYTAVANYLNKLKAEAEVIPIDQSA